LLTSRFISDLILLEYKKQLTLSAFARGPLQVQGPILIQQVKKA